MKAQGLVHKYGSNVDTDVISTLLIIRSWQRTAWRISTRNSSIG